MLLDVAMTQDSSIDAAGLTAGERDYIRRELDVFFSTLPTVAEGFQLKTWRGGVKGGTAEGALGGTEYARSWADAT